MNKETKNEKQDSGNTVIYQFRADMGYPIFLQFMDTDLEKELQFVIHDLGFSISKIATMQECAKQKKYRLLRVSSASSKVLKKITSYSQDAFGLGQELVENFGYYEIYVMMRYAMMIMSQSSFQWEMALDKQQILTQINTPQAQRSMRLCFNRFLSSALAFLDVMSFWGQLRNQTFRLMNQSQTENNCVFIDMQRNMAFAGAKAAQLLNTCELKVVNEKHKLLKEEVYSFLAARTLYFSSGQIPKAYMLQLLTRLVASIPSLSGEKIEVDQAA